MARHYNSSNRRGVKRGIYAKTEEEKYKKFSEWYEKESNRKVVNEKSRFYLYYLDEKPSKAEFKFMLKELGSLTKIKEHMKNFTTISTSKMLNYEMSKLTDDKRLLLNRATENTTQWLTRIKGTEAGDEFIKQLSTDYEQLKAIYGVSESKKMISNYYFGS